MMYQLVGMAKEILPGHSIHIEENINLSGSNELAVTGIGFNWAKERATYSILEVRVWQCWVNARGGVDQKLLYVLDTTELLWHFAE